LLASLVALTLGTSAAAPLVLYPLQSNGLDAATTRSIDAALRAQIASPETGMDRFKLYSLGETQSVLRPPGGTLGLSCEGGDDDCLAGVGRLLSGSVVAFGRLARDGVELWLVDAKTSGEVRRVQIRGPPLEAAREAAVALLTPDRYVGLLSVEGGRGRVAVDGVSRGDLPLPSPLVLEVGRHVVTLTIPEQGSWDVDAEVRFGQTFVVTADSALRRGAQLAAKPAPEVAVSEPRAPGGSPLRSVAYVALAAGVLSLGAGIACGAISADNADGLRAMTRPIPLSQFSLVNQDAQRTQNFALAADVLFGAAAVLGVTGVVLYLVGGNHGTSVGVVKLEANGVSIAF
jgi:hypothetical protein